MDATPLLQRPPRLTRFVACTVVLKALSHTNTFRHVHNFPTLLGHFTLCIFCISWFTLFCSSSKLAADAGLKQAVGRRSCGCGTSAKAHIGANSGVGVGGDVENVAGGGGHGNGVGVVWGSGRALCLTRHHTILYIQFQIESRKQPLLHVRHIIAVLREDKPVPNTLPPLTLLSPQIAFKYVLTIFQDKTPICNPLMQ